MSQVGTTVGPFTAAEPFDIPERGDWFVADRLYKDRPVWIRICDDSDSADLAAVQSMYERLQHLDHPCIPKVLHQDPGSGHLAVSAPVGVPLSRLLEHRADPAFAMTPATVLDVACSLADVLVHAHERGRPHGRLDPSMVWLGADGELIVWGFGWGVGAASDEAWIAPEAARGGRASGDADQWALGAMVAALVTGRVPWSGDDLRLSAKQGDTSHLWGPVTEQWKPLGRILQRTLESEPRQRFPSAHPVRQALQALAQRVRQSSDAPAVGAELASRYGPKLDVQSSVEEVLLPSSAAMTPGQDVVVDDDLGDAFDPVHASRAAAPVASLGAVGLIKEDPFDAETVRPTTPTRVPSLGISPDAALSLDPQPVGPKPVATQHPSPSLQPVGPAVEIGPITIDQQPRDVQPKPVEVDVTEISNEDREPLDIRRVAPVIVSGMFLLLSVYILQSIFS